MAPSSNVAITISVGLIEKLAGINRPRKELQAATPSPQPGLPPRPPGLSAEAAAVVAKDAQLTRALSNTKQIGRLLLKQEEAETRKVSDLAEELLSKHRSTPRPAACEAERQACLDCYKSNAQDPLHCSAAVDAYSRCAQRHAGTKVL